jgi:hypothetical protein
MEILSDIAASERSNEPWEYSVKCHRECVPVYPDQAMHTHTAGDYGNWSVSLVPPQMLVVDTLVIREGIVEKVRQTVSRQGGAL